MRVPLIAGNWKMNKTVSEALELVNALGRVAASADKVDVLVCPPFTALYAVGRAIAEGNLRMSLGAQDMFLKDSGAYTGMISPAMLKDVGCTYVICGHSERRGRFGVPEDWMTRAIHDLFGDSDETVHAKAVCALEHGLTPIVCFGETIDERRAGNTDLVVDVQLRDALAGMSGEDVARLVLAYEPVWAIGTGETCDAEEANRVCGMAREIVCELAGEQAAEKVRIQYGGSVKPENAGELMGQEHIDGALVGGASLKADSFSSIIATTQELYG